MLPFFYIADYILKMFNVYKDNMIFTSVILII
jgi:hypothetical protein